jgi:ABC-type Fe3+ transport system permease subunit
MPTCEHNWSSGKVHDIAYLGGHSVFYVELPSGKLVQSFVANAERWPAPDLGRSGLRMVGRRQRRGTALMNTKLKRRLQRITPSGRHVVIGIPFLWLFLFFMLPFFIVLKISFAEADVAIPPYTEIYTFAEQKLQLVLNLANYSMLGDDELYIAAYLGSLKMAFFSTLLCLLIGYPMAYAIASAARRCRPCWCC